MKAKHVCTLALALSLSLSSVMHVQASNRVDELLAGMTLDQKIGQMLMPDFRKWKTEGASGEANFTTMNDEVKEIIDHYDFGGVILFAENVKETEQTLKLTVDMQEAAISNEEGNGNLPLLLTIDQEGGIVYRLGSGTALPGNMALGATRSPDLARQAGEVIGRELNALGINVNFAPVFDTNNNPNNPVIGLRSFSSDPQIVSELGVPMMQGMQEYNVATAAKHFPGHGDTATDSHTGLPLVDKSLDELKALELIPFQAAVDNGVDMLMTAHIQYPQIETEQVISKLDNSTIYVPATLSDDVITGIVRNQMNYEGIVVTDALNMKAISEHFGESEACIKAIQADVDILLMPTVLRSKADLAKLDKIIEDIKAAVESGEIDIQTIDKSVRRILTLKEKRGILDYENDIRSWEEKLSFANEQVGSQQNRDIEREIAASAVTVVKNENNVLPLQPKAGEKLLLLTPYSNETPGMELSVRRLIDQKIIDPNVEYESVVYKGMELADIKAKIDGADYVIAISEVGSAAQMADTHWLTNMPTEICNYAKSLGKTSVILSISKPYDVSHYESADAIVAAYGNKGMDPTEALRPDNAFGPNIPAGVEVILGGHDAVGKLPVPINKFVDGKFNDEIVYPLGHGIMHYLNVDKTALDAYVEEVKDTEKKLYTLLSYTVFVGALDHAKNVSAGNSYSQDEVDDALAQLRQAYEELVPLGDRAPLQALVDEVKALKEADYTAETWKTLMTALEKAESVLDQIEALDPELKEAYDALKAARDGLKKVPTPEVKPDKPVETGDTTTIALYVGGMMLALGGLALLKKRKYN